MSRNSPAQNSKLGLAKRSRARKSTTQNGESLPARAQLARIESAYRNGIPARVIIDTFREAGACLSEATFRKYVQVGLIPRSRRVGEKGRFRGSHGLYPVATLRLIDAIKRLLNEGHSLSEIKRSSLVIANHLTSLEKEFTEVLAALVRSSDGEPNNRRIRREADSLRRDAQRLLVRIARLGTNVTPTLSKSSIPPHPLARRGGSR